MGESIEPASKRRKNKKHFTAFHLGSLFAPRETLDVIKKQTRIPSVIFPPYAYKTYMKKYETKHHNIVFINTDTWDSHPKASPEGPGTTPYEKY